jgi:uncharacterized repeat protein (TIGR01451 family)
MTTSWDPGEYCGYDACKTTGVPDMNHDCLLDALDYQLFIHEARVNAMGPNLSGDFKSAGAPGPAPCGGDLLCPDGKVTNADLSFLLTKVGQTASPCTAVPIPSVCNGTIAISFSSNPSTIVSNATQPAGPLQTAYVVISSVVNAEMVEYGLKTSPNVVIVGNSGGPSDAWGSLCSSPGYRDEVLVMSTPVASGPAIVQTLQYILTDSGPASITILPALSCPYTQTRWTDSSVSLIHKFASMSGVGINGPTSASIPGCTSLGQISGQVYSDKDFNCAYASGTDDLLTGLVVQAGTYYAITDASGNYSLTLPVGSYTVKMAAAVNDPWKKFSACQSPTTYPVTVVANGTYPGKNFAMLPIAHITGMVYRDFTGTTACAKDGIDAPVPSRMMLASAGNYVALTDQNGNYAINVPAGPYILSNYPVSGDPWGLPGCQPASYSFTLAANMTASGKDFALNLVDPNKPCDVFLDFSSHDIITNNPPCFNRAMAHPCPGRAREYLVTLNENLLSGVKLGTVAKLDINLDPKFTISTVTSSCNITFTSPNAHERVVSITNDITPGQTCVVTVLATPSTDGPYTSTVTLDDQGVGCTGTKVRTLAETSSCSCDPNDMAVQPGCGPDGQVAQGAPLTYAIQFENVGTGRAHNIFIDDVLDEDLDANTVSIVSSSHPVTGVQVSGGNKLQISFEAIDLAGTLGPESNHGQVIFSVRPLPIEEQNDSYVENTASITFDFNDPVITNTVVTTFVDDPCVATAVNNGPKPLSNYLGSNYPNPFNPTTTITYGLATQARVSIAIYNINGSLVRTLVSEDKPAGWYTVNWDGRDQSGRAVASGVYFSRCEQVRSQVRRSSCC